MPFIKSPGVSTSYDPTHVGEEKIKILVWPLISHVTLLHQTPESGAGCQNAMSTYPDRAPKARTLVKQGTVICCFALSSQPISEDGDKVLWIYCL